jgi:hypothetical protein
MEDDSQQRLRRRLRRRTRASGGRRSRTKNRRSQHKDNQRSSAGHPEHPTPHADFSTRLKTASLGSTKQTRFAKHIPKFGIATWPRRSPVHDLPKRMLAAPQHLDNNFSWIAREMPNSENKIHRVLIAVECAMKMTH